MNSETGEMKEFSSNKYWDELCKSAEGENWKVLPKRGVVLELYGCKFMIENYDIPNRRMILRGISKEEANYVLQGGNPEKILG